MAQNDRIGIEDILFRKGIISANQLSALKLEAINTGQPVDQLLKRHKIVNLLQILEAKAELLGVPFVNIEGKAISTQWLNLIPEAVARRYHLVPFEQQGDKLYVAMADPLDVQVIQFIEKKTGLFVKPFLALPDELNQAILEQYAQNLTTDVTSALQEVSAFQKPSEEVVADKAEVIHEAPVANIITQLLEYAVKSRASDIHIEPMEDKTRVRYRIDGILHEKIILPRGVHDALISRIKIMSNLKIEEKRLPQDGRFSYSTNKNTFDLRISTVPTVYGEKVVMRLLPKTIVPPTLPELGLRGVALKNLEFQITRPHGIILICGPTGSGKTTTLYSILTKQSTTRINLLTIEDPVEYRISGANQVQVNTQIGLTFASALRSFLRQDPNVMLVGEIRDTETADLAIQAALTGHQVFSTLHTNSAAGSLPRLLDMGMEPFLLASSINMAVGQRILRKVCPYCRTKFTPPPEVIENMRRVLGKFFNPVSPPEIYKGIGCKECGQVGYLGRIGIFEVLPISTKISQLILERSSASVIEDVAVAEGMITLKQDGYLKVLEGVTTLEEVLRVAED